jgi:cytochrome d ubiquinol oxidase subunit I
MNVDLARWQFAFATVNHFLFVPVTIGLAFLTVLLQTAWHRSRREEYLRQAHVQRQLPGAPQGV